MKKNSNKSPKKAYKNQIKKYTLIVNELNKKFNLISRLRIVVFSCSMGCLIYLFYYNYNFIGAIVIFLSLVFFLRLVVIHSRIKEKIQIVRQMLQINDFSIARLNDNWSDFEDCGDDFLDTQHNYSYDLDLFGKSSLFQFISTINTYLGRKIIKKMLTDTPENIDQIKKRQEAIQELAYKLDWRQNFQALGAINSKDIRQNPSSLLAWSCKEERIVKSRNWSILLRIFPFIIFAFMFFAFWYGGIFTTFTYILLLIQLILTRIKKSAIDEILILAVKYKKVISTYKKLVIEVEEEKFNSKYLINLKENLKSNDFKKASIQINKLEKIVDYINIRRSSLYFLLNMIFLLNWQCYFALKNWKKSSGAVLPEWLNIVGQFESMASFSILAFDHPGWCFPELVKDKYFFNAKDLGHPLLPEKSCIHNDFLFKGDGKVVMVTGSNMSGKSTMLRTVGINLILAYSGAPVCASKMKCSIMYIYTSMRVVDNLKSNISSFYAELLRIKMILDAIRSGKEVFFLLDEIFKGTNSRDRKMGAIAVLKNLTTAKTTGIVSTHDLELTDLERNKDFNLMNYYFKETYQNKKIFFDYKIRKGVSYTSDVKYLMEIIGLSL